MGAANCETYVGSPEVIKLVDVRNPEFQTGKHDVVCDLLCVRWYFSDQFKKEKLFLGPQSVSRDLTWQDLRSRSFVLAISESKRSGILRDTGRDTINSK